MSKSDSDAIGCGCLVVIILFFAYKDVVINALLVILAAFVVSCFAKYIDRKIKETKLKRELEEKKKILEEKHKMYEFERLFPSVVKRYFSVTKVLETKKSLKVYKRLIETIHSKNMDLFFKTKAIREKKNKYYQLISELEKTLKISNDEEKNSISIGNLKKLKDRYVQCEEYISKADYAINETAQIFLNIESELILADSNDYKAFEAVASTVDMLESKSKSLTYIQSNMPVFE